MTTASPPPLPSSPSCSLLQFLAAVVVWLVMRSCDPFPSAAGTSALAAVTGFLILLACGVPGAFGISLAQATLIASGQSTLAHAAMMLHAAAPGIGAYFGFAAIQHGLGIGPQLEGLRQRHIPLLVLATTLSTASLHAAAAYVMRDETSHAALLQLVLTNFIVIMLVMVTMLITIRALRQCAVAR